MRKYSLKELQLHLQRVVTLNFQEACWVTAEIAQVSQNKGHWYIDLVEKRPESNRPDAQSKAIIWSKNMAVIRQSIGPLVEQVLQQGFQVSLLVEVQFHTVYGLFLNVIDLDLEYSLGKLELERQKTLQWLRDKGLMNLNAQRTLPATLQRLAIVSSSKAAGYLDFISHLEINPYGYVFHYTLFETSVQGREMELDILNSLKIIRKEAQKFDCIIIIRGGGSKMDLAGFDLRSVAEAVSNLPLPVLTGIGHEIDQTVTDMVAYRSFKTPTAVANFLLDHQSVYENSLFNLLQKINLHTRKKLERHSLMLLQNKMHITQLLNLQLDKKKYYLDYSVKTIQRLVWDYLKQEETKLKHSAEIIDILDPRKILLRGYSITKKDGIRIFDPKQVRRGDVLTTILANGNLKSIAEELPPYEKEV